MQSGAESPAVRLAGDRWQAVYTLDGSRFNLQHDGRLWLAGGVASLATDQWLLRPEACGPGEARMEAFDGPMGSGRRLVITHRGQENIQMTIRFALYERYAGLTIDLSVTNLGTKPLRVFGFNILEVPGDKASFWPGQGGTDGSVLKNGFHSRSIVALRRPGDSDAPAGGREGWLRYGDPGTRPFRNRNQFISNWVCALKSRSGDERCVMGFLSGSRQLGHFFYRRPERVEDFLARSEAEGALLTQGESLLSETLYLTIGTDESELLGECYQAMGETGGARKHSLPAVFGCLAAEPQQGREELARKVALWAGLSGHVPLDGIIVDPGLLQEDKALESIYAEAAGLIQVRGLKPGVRWAPLAVAEGSTIAREHPEWLIRQDGKPSPGGTLQERRLFGLDATHPQAQQYLREQVRRLIGWGHREIVLDLLNTGALPGDFYRPEATRIENIRQALEIIRGEAPQAFIIGAWCPIGPAVGLVDAVEMSPVTEPPHRKGLLSGTRRARPERNSPSGMSGGWAATHGRLWSSAVRYELLEADHETEASLLPPLDSGMVILLSGSDEAVANSASWLPRRLGMGL